MAIVLVLLALALGVFAPAVHANVQEQRARLPPPATCTDPVEGIWMSHKYSPDYGDWYMFTLKIHRVPGSATELTGEILSHSWNGTPQEEQPPPCRPGLDHWQVFMTARGHAQPGGQIFFGGTAWRPDQAFCGRAPGPGMYNLDNFSGTIDPAIQEFQSVNNDGGRSVNDPMVFRRVRCLDNPTPNVPRPTVRPPPIYPEGRGGCSLF